MSIISITFCNVTCRPSDCFSCCAISFEDSFCYKLFLSKGLSSVEIHSLAISWAPLVVILLKVDILHYGLNGIYGYVLSKLLYNPHAIFLCHLFSLLNSSVPKYFSNSNDFSICSVASAFTLCNCSHSLINVITLNF